MTKSDWSPFSVKLTALAVAVSLFVAGAITGAAVYRWAKLDACGEGGPPLPHAPWEMLRPLNLTEEQQKSVRAVFDRYKPSLDAVLRETFPKVRAVQEQIDSEIAKLLTEEQRQRFESQRKHHGPPPGMPPMGLPSGHDRFPPPAPPGAEPFGPDGPMRPPPPPPPPIPSNK